MKILLIEDDAETAAHLRNGLREHGHVVDHAAEGREGLFLAAGGSHDLLIVDRMLPQLDGLAIVKTIRSAGVRTPVLFLTTMGGIDDRVEGLTGGYYERNRKVTPSPLARDHAIPKRLWDRSAALVGLPP